MSKWMELREAAALVNDGDLVGLGGNALNRAPVALACELARQKRRNLRLLTTAGALEVDLLCFAGCVTAVDAAFIGYETEFGLANHYRKAVQEGRVKANEHSCYTLISGLRAAQAGVPFMPVAGLVNTELLSRAEYFKSVADPFSGKTVNAVKAYSPDVSLIHADEADEMGNIWIEGPLYDDKLLSRASRKVIVTVERKVPVSKSVYRKEKPQIPGFLVDAVVLAPKGAAPGPCSPAYEIDSDGIREFLSIKDQSGLSAWLQKRNPERGGFYVR